MLYPDDLTVDAIREYIREELRGKKVPISKTVEKWLNDYGILGIKTRIEDHVSYWKKELAASSLTSIEDYIIGQFGEKNLIFQGIKPNRDVLVIIEGYPGIESLSGLYRHAHADGVITLDDEKLKALVAKTISKWLELV